MTRSERAMQVWMILLCAAHERKCFTYREVANFLGFQGAGVLSQILDRIMRYCDDNDLPPLTSLVIRQDTLEPGDGLTTVTNLSRDQQSVFNKDWFSLYPVQIIDFDRYA